MQPSNSEKEKGPFIDASLDGKDPLDIAGEEETTDLGSDAGIDTSQLLVLLPHSQPLCVICDDKPAYNDGRRALLTCGDTCATALQDAKNAFRTRYATNPRSHPLCAVCNEKPAYNDGRRAFPTCGNTCARMLEAAKKRARSTTNPNYTNPHPYDAPVNNGYRPPTTSSLRWRDQTDAEMVETTPPSCQTCLTRQQEERIRKETAAHTGALDQIAPYLDECLHGDVAEMCEFCEERSKVNNSEPVAGGIFATCETCLICWQKDKMSDKSDFCSDACIAVADKKAPLLVEIPRGHAAFKKVSDYYTSQWKDTRTTCPGIKKVYMVIMKPDSAPIYEQYKTQVGNPLFKRKGNERQLWFGLKRECGFGDTGNMEPCASKKCLLCILVRSSISREVAAQGILSTSSLAKAIETSSHRGKSAKVVLLAKVLLGRVTEISKHEIGYGMLPPHGYESVHLVEYKTLWGKVDDGESLVFDGDAIMPLYLITYE